MFDRIAEVGKSQALSMLKIRGAVLYLRAVCAARTAFLGGTAVVLAVALSTIGVIAVHVGIFLLLDLDVKTTAIVLVCLGAVYIAVGVVILMRLTSEKTWMRVTRGSDVVNQALSPRKKRKA
jgi:hypothetical protein